MSETNSSCAKIAIPRRTNRGIAVVSFASVASAPDDGHNRQWSYFTRAREIVCTHVVPAVRPSTS